MSEIKILKTHHDLEVWKRSVDLVIAVYGLTNRFPQSEIYGLTSQIRRSAISIPSNIAEGAGRNSSKDFNNFLGIAAGSLAELETQLIIASKLSYLDKEKLDEINNELIVIRKMLFGLKKAVNSKR